MKHKKEPEAIRELHRIRAEMLAEEKRVGRDQFWAEANRLGDEFARKHGLKRMKPASGVMAVRERPAKYKTR